MTPWVELSPPHAIQSPSNGALPELPDNIWSRILGYATHVHGYNYLEMDDELARLSEQEQVNVTRRHAVLVSKRFYVSSQMLYDFSLSSTVAHSAWVSHTCTRLPIYQLTRPHSHSLFEWKSPPSLRSLFACYMSPEHCPFSLSSTDLCSSW